MLAELLIAGAFAGAALPERTCQTRIEGPRPGLVTRPSDLVTPNLVFHGIRQWATKPIRGVRGGDAVAKSGISVRAGAPVVLRIAPADRDVAALDYIMSTWKRKRRTIADGFPAIRVRPCPPDQPRFSDEGAVGKWTSYSGGFLLRRAACITISIERSGHPTLHRRIGFGRRCPTRR